MPSVAYMLDSQTLKHLHELAVPCADGCMTKIFTAEAAELGHHF
jgi:hypothetical protein